jgi:RecG-like helicase
VHSANSLVSAIEAAILPYFPTVARFKFSVEKLTQTPEETRNEGLRHWASSVPNAIPIAQLEERKHQCTAGVIQNIRIDPREGSGYVEATIIDGTGEFVLRWLGRRSMSGISLGMGLVVDGIVGRHKNELMMLNPEYELVPGPEHG